MAENKDGASLIRETYKMGILGIGNMGSVIVKALISNKILKPEEVSIFDIKTENCEKLSKELGVIIEKNESDLFIKSRYILFAVKPQVLEDVLGKIKSTLIKDFDLDNIMERKTIISIAAGIPISFYEERFGKKAAVVRIMPNILALVNEAASALTRNKNATDEDFSFVNGIFDKIGVTVQVPENLLDAVTGLSGSGPAFIAILVEAMADGGVKMGLPRDIAYKLAAQTVKGTGEMLLRTKMHPGVMKDIVSSPAGTTITGIHALERNGFRNTIITAIEAATLRSKELKK
ncbi:MAG: pyrroline-5-carboxylate reductase [Promethearchaeota archaeon]